MPSPAFDRDAFSSDAFDADAFDLGAVSAVAIYDPRPDLFLAEITVWDPDAEEERVLRYATAAFTTRPSESPPNTHYRERLKQPAALRRDAFDSGTTGGRSRVSYGDLLLLNDDAALDDLADFGFDGRALTIWRGRRGAAYPGEFTKVFVGTMEQGYVGTDVVTIKLRDNQATLDVPLQATKYLGDNVEPDGLEGTASDLKGKPKPITLGRAFNVPPTLVNAAKLIYQVHDSAVQEITGVYDRGIPLTTGFPLTMQSAGFEAVSDGIFASAFGNGVFVIAGDSGHLETSTDGGVTWTPRVSGFGTDIIMALCYGGGQFVAVGGSGKISTSPDGVTWTAQSSDSFGAGAIVAVTYGNGLFVAGGYDGTDGHLETSPDGVTWTPQASTFGAGNAINGVAYGAGRFVAIGEDGHVASSVDGSTWTAGIGTWGTTDLAGITFGGGQFVAVGADATIATSADGLYWTNRASGFPSAYIIQCIAFGNGIYIAAGYDGGSHPLIATSSDGRAWEQRPSGFAPSAIIWSLAFGGGLFVATDEATYTVGTTTGVVDYASEADLLDDALQPAAGTYNTYRAGGLFRLGGATPSLITADVVEGASAGDRTAGQLFVRVLERAGYSPGDWSADDVAALDLACEYELGYFADTETTFSAALDAIAGSVRAWWGTDRLGVFRIQQLTPPSGDPVASFTANGIVKGSLQRLPTNDKGRGLPTWSTTVRWAKNYRVQQGTDVADNTSAARRALITRPWRDANVNDAAVPTAHPLAVAVTEESLLVDETAAITEAARRQGIWGVRRDRIRFTVPLNDRSESVDLFHVVSLTHHRFQLAGGKLFRVLSVQPDYAARRVSLDVWG